ncbi:MAG: TonB-dependent receptor [Balneolaceae bacterium]|nr:TonB-dependent receptor [Balneolaceae bacterium]MCH8549109.1 TonB-dependent receptor [Balneolaceae bacterium]
MLNKYVYLLAAGVFMLFAGLSEVSTAQSVTGANINGTVTDTDGEPLPGATVIAVHEPSGTEYGTVTRSDGRFNIRNARIGGPYTVRVSFVGFRAAEQTDINLQLSQDYRVNFELVDETMELGEVAVTAQRDAIISGDRSGARSRVGRDQLDALPSINRSIQDYTRLSPQVSGSNVAGRSGRRNAIQIDGVTFDDRFGLGGDAIPTLGNPISLDAIQEFQVEIAPFDVRQGNFTGGAVNAVTRSGTNTLEGSTYFYGRNQSLISGTLLGEDSPIDDFNEYQAGIRLGGPIIEDELFFFVNAEIKRESSPLFNFEEANFNSTTGEVQEIINISQNQYGYDPGGFDRLTSRSDDWKLFLKLDWNMSDNHRLTYQQNLVRGVNDAGIGRGFNSFTLDNRQYQLRGNQSNFAVMLNSNWTNNISGEAKVAYTRLRQERDVSDDLFPSVVVETPTGGNVNLGTERFSQANELDQDYLELTYNLTYFAGNHQFTVGTNNYFNSFRNLFLRDAAGHYVFSSTDDESGIERFARGAPTSYEHSYSTDVNAFGQRPEANWGYNTYSLYAQTEWSVSDNLTLTLGARGDITHFTDDPPSNTQFAQDFPGFDTGNVPSTAFQFNPRFGFNWNDGNTQIRGGAGLFSGGEPGVWLSNQYSNTGVDVGRVAVSEFAGESVPTFSADPNNQPQPGDGTGLAPDETTEINITDPDFKINQIFRSNLAVEQRLPWSLVGTVEFIYSNNLQDINYQNLNLGPENVNARTADGRPFYGNIVVDEDGNASFTRNRVSDNFTDVILLTNTDQGHQYSLTAQLRREFQQGFFGDISYTYSDGRSINDGTSSQAISNWRFNEVQGDPNNAELGRTIHLSQHRILASASYRLDYGRNSTVFSFIYEGRSGRPHHYAYFTPGFAGFSANGDFEGGNDLVYVPTGPDDNVNLTSDNWDELEEFIEANPGLRDYRGQITERGAQNMPWINQFDIRVTQRIQTTGSQSLEISFDVLNFGNMVGNIIGRDEWGVQRTASFNNVTELTFLGYDVEENTDGTYDLTPRISFDRDRVPTNIDQYNVSNTNSRWRAQLGLRYSF